jgi:preprotein translocase subunit SecD
MQLMYMVERNSQGQVSRIPIVVRSRASMTGEGIVEAKINTANNMGDISVTVSFNETSSRQFGDLTTNNVQRRLAIVLDGVVQSAPVIREPIINGAAEISGDFTLDQARDLAVTLRSGALPAPVNVLEQRTVGPSLGRDSIDRGVTAALIGGVLVLVFMLIYYKISGIAADIAVLLNIYILMAVMVAMGATLTLPGIAGIILTIGMAVDANVLINERIREELRLGKTPAAAVDTGYARATVTILDANLTTILAAIVLYQFGSGPIKGFAVTLTIGLASSMFTAIFVTRILFDYIIKRYRPKTLSI